MACIPGMLLEEEFASEAFNRTVADIGNDQSTILEIVAVLNATFGDHSEISSEDDDARRKGNMTDVS